MTFNTLSHRRPPCARGELSWNIRTNGVPEVRLPSFQHQVSWSITPLDQLLRLQLVEAVFDRPFAVNAAEVVVIHEVLNRPGPAVAVHFLEHRQHVPIRPIHRGVLWLGHRLDLVGEILQKTEHLAMPFSTIP